MTRHYEYDEQALAEIIRNFVGGVLHDVLRPTAQSAASSEVDEDLGVRLDDAVTRALKTEFESLNFIGMGNPQMLTCDMPNNSHQFRPNSRSRHCSFCNADYCASHPLTYCVRCGNKL
jgi:hypothetical protein